MAKGNMLQGMARGKVGDVVFSRLHGEQISRVRNRHPKNPRTNAQLYQRAIMATVMQAYSAGKVIFDHAFQGKAVGAENQRRFMTLNAKLLRSTVANDLNNAVAVNEQKGRVVAPGVPQFVPFEMIISEGNYAQNFFTVDTSRGSDAYEITAPAKNADEKVSEYAVRNGLLPGDIYTIVIMATDVDQNREALYTTPNTDSSLGKVYNSQFAWVRLTVKSDVLENETVLGSETLAESKVFDIEYSTGIDSTGFTHISGLGAGDYVTALLNSHYGCFGIIRSRKDQDLRSTSSLVVDFGSSDDSYFGIASQYIIEAWKAGAQTLGDSDLILEGGDQ